MGASPEVAELVKQAIYLRWMDAVQIVATTSREGMELVEKNSPVIVFLYSDLADANLEEVIRGIRSSQLGIIVLAEKTQGDNVRLAVAFAAGADDYIRLPVDLSELMLRTYAVLRRLQAPEVAGVSTKKSSLRVGDLLLKSGTQELFLAGKKIELTSTEFEMLYLLVSNRHRVVSKGTLKSEVWGANYRDEKIVQKYVQRLRQKLGDDAKNPILIATVHGVGYRFIGPPPE